MNGIRIKATSDELSINGKVWVGAPPTSEVCIVLGTSSLADGHDVIIDRKPVYRFRYFDELGIGVQEDIAKERIVTFDFYFEVGKQRERKILVYGGRELPSKRRTEAIFTGVIEINGREIRSPLRPADFPISGDLVFQHHIALGKTVTATYWVKGGLVDVVGLGFRFGDMS